MAKADKLVGGEKVKLPTVQWVVRVRGTSANGSHDDGTEVTISGTAGDALEAALLASRVRQSIADARNADAAIKDAGEAKAVEDALAAGAPPLMIAWLALGLVVLAVAAVVVMDRRRYVQSKARFAGLERRIDQSGRDHAEQLGQASRVFDERLGTVVWDLRAALEENKERGRVELTEEQIRDLRVTWGTLVCSSCGNVHGGLCPRVREVRYSPNGNYERILFWGDGRWELPEGTITPWDVFGVTVAPPPQKEEQKK